MQHRGLVVFYIDRKSYFIVLSVIMKNETLIKAREFSELTKSHGGVFSTSELRTLFNTKSDSSFFSVLKSLEEVGTIKKFARGFYITENFDPLLLCARIIPQSYISMGTILSRNGLIGTIAAKEINAIRVGRTRLYSREDLRIKYFGIKETLFFGFHTVRGIKLADNEKAFIDTISYYLRGHQFVFNPTVDIDLDLLDRRVLLKYLSQYKNQKFVSYVRSLIDG